MKPRETFSTSPVVWDEAALREVHARPDKAQRVRAMFNAIAPSYERINTLATLGRDAVWRRRAVAAAGVQPADVVLDVACGTGDMIRAFARARPAPARIIGVDFASQMLARGDYRGLAVPIELIEADALRLPLGDRCVDAISCAFGVRNLQDLAAGLREMFRVARPGARVVILEFALPEQALLRWAYRFYCDAVLPRLGRLMARDRVGAYRYLPRSVQTFESPDAMTARLSETGFSRVTTWSMNFGGVVLYRGEKAGAEELG
jgi:demethylmenaquinone methyltransferase/2-methoxy-6-polyprenyl-1,4-benzoquinol methylase